MIVLKSMKIHLSFRQLKTKHLIYSNDTEKILIINRKSHFFNLDWLDEKLFLIFTNLKKQFFH